MKRLLLLVTICISSVSFGQIAQNDTIICLGDSTILSIINTGICGTQDATLDNGLSCWYPMCSNANDLSPSLNNGVLNGVLSTQDYFNNQNSAYEFNGVNNTIDLPNPFLNGSQANAFTVNARVKFNDLSNDPNIWGKTKFWGEVNFAVLSTGQVQFWWANSITGNKYSRIKTDNSVILPGQWYDITVVFQNGNGQIYINSQPVSTGLLWTAQGGTTLSTSQIENSCNFSQDANSSKFGVRKSGGSFVGYLNGIIDEFKIWDYALNQTLIDQNYNSVSNSTIIWSNGISNQDSIVVAPTQTTTYSVNITTGNSSLTDSVTIVVSNPQVDAGVDLDICNGDDIILSGSGADTYAWSGGVTDGVAFGPTVSEYYYVTGTDALGCEDNDSLYVTVLQPTASSITESNCDTYTAPDGATYTSTGNYTAVIPNAVGCDSTITIDLTITNSTTSSITETVCDTYTAPDGATYTSTGNYTAVIPNAIGCDSTISIDLTVNNSNTGSETVTECDSYTWSANGQTYTQSGQYTEVLTNVSGCDSTLTLNLTIETIGITTQPIDQSVIVGNIAQFSIVTSSLNPTYQWQMNDGTGWIDLFNAGQYSGTDTDVLTISNVQLTQDNFIYRCILADDSNCSGTSDVAVLTVEDNTGLEELNQQISIYPNPTSTSFTITSKNSINSSFKLMDIQGKVVLTGKIESTEETVDISKLSKGQYNLVFEDESISPISIIKN